MQPMTRQRASHLARLMAAMAALALAAPASAGKIKVEGDWTEVRQGWPLDDRDYFVATEKGHHFIELRNLPKNLDADLNVRLEYYFSYKRVRPAMQIAACDTNKFELVSQESTDSNKWQTHERRVNHRDCLKRNELAYSVILHDAGDVFAWRLMEVKSVTEAPATTTSAGPTEATTATTPSEPAAPETTLSHSDEPTTQVTAEVPAATRTPSSPTEESIATESAPTTTSSTEPAATSSTEPTPVATEPPSTTRDPIRDLIDHEAASPLPTEAPTEALPTVPKESPAKSELEESQNESGDSPLIRIRRFAAERQNTGDAQRDRRTKQLVRVNESCKPSSCDRHKFHMARFSPLTRGVPELATGQKAAIKSYHLNLKNKPLVVKLESSNKNELTEADVCLKFQLYMDANSVLEFLLERGQQQQSDSKEGRGPQPDERLLEVFSRTAGSSKAGTWDKIERCISDYVPRLTRADLASDKSVRFIFRPRSSPSNGGETRIALAFDPSPDSAGALRKLHPSLSYLPDIRLHANESEFNKYWRLDNSQSEGAHLRLGAAEQRASSDPKVLTISHIPGESATFDLTSRWLRIVDAELLEQPVLVVYRAKRPDWLERVEFQCQRAGSAGDEWISQLAYTAPTGDEAAPSGGSPSNTAPENTTTPARTGAHSSIDLPIRIKGIGADEFRVRLRHHAKARPLAASGPRELAQQDSLSIEVRTLAFADACTYRRDYCRNGGLCKPTGAAQAECLCRAGYSGRFCERVHPCDVMYGNQSGKQLCASLGARCVEGLPVMRCEWPNDRFYQCKKLFRLDAGPNEGANSGANTAGPKPSAQADESSAGQSEKGQLHPGGVGFLVDGADQKELPQEELIGHLKNAVTQQAKMILILAVFLISIVVFALVLLGSMVSRLRKSARRLKRSQGDLHELARRVRPGGQASLEGNGSVLSTSFGRASGAKTLGYNNSAFDVE